MFALTVGKGALCVAGAVSLGGGFLEFEGVGFAGGEQSNKRHGNDHIDAAPFALAKLLGFELTGEFMPINLPH